MACASPNAALVLTGPSPYNFAPAHAMVRHRLRIVLVKLPFTADFDVCSRMRSIPLGYTASRCS
eukprot:2493144-Amphidinium_carterae.1